MTSGKHFRLIATVCSFLGIVPAAADAPVPESSLYAGPLIDAHGHIGGSFDFDTVLKVMDANGVRWQVLMARYYPGPAGDEDLPGSDDDSLRLARAHPGRFIPLVGMQRPELSSRGLWEEPDEIMVSILHAADKKLASREFFGIGEVIVRHYSYSRGRHAELDQPVYSTFMKRLADLARKHAVPIVAHMEGEPELRENLARLVGEYGDVTFVWAHNCGRSHAPVIREMLGRFRNLVCDLGGMTNVGRINYGTGRPRMGPHTSLMEEGGVFLPAMRELYEDFPDRFVIGMDVAHANGMNMRNYSRRARRFRILLGQLKPETARAIGETNAIRIFRPRR